MKSLSNERGRSKDARQVGFFLFNPKLHPPPPPPGKKESLFSQAAELYIENIEVNGYLFSTNMGCFQKSIFFLVRLLIYLFL